MRRQIYCPIPAQNLIAITTIPTSTNPGHFNAWFGKRLLTTWRAPFLDACSILVGEGVSGETVASMRHVDSKTIALTATLAGAAAPTVDENPRPRFRAWRAWDKAPPIAPSHREALSGKADAESAPAAGMVGIRRRTA
jgi:hypothetical protein